MMGAERGRLDGRAKRYGSERRLRVKVDYYLPEVTLDQVADRAAWAQRIGFDGLFTADTSHNPFFPVAASAAAAPDLDYGTAIAVAFARSPMVVAQASWDLAHLTGGRFLLGLGTQIKPHIERRFSMPWGSPALRLAEYIEALRAIWNTWQNREPLRFKGVFYSFTLMTPFFDPGPIEHPDVPVYIAGVGPLMARLAGEMCDGYHVHPFHSPRYLREVTLPAMQKGAEAEGRSLDDVEMTSTVFAVTGRDEAEMAEMRRGIKQQMAFYASTPAYAGMLECHGWDFGPTLTAMSKRGEWSEMADVIPDEAVSEVAVEAPPEELGAAVRARYRGLLDRAGLYPFGANLENMTDDQWSAVVESIRA